MTGAASPADAVRAWQQVRASHDIQFAPVEVPPAKPPSGWLYELLKAIGDFLARIFGRLGEAIGISWPVFKWVLLAIAVALVLLLLWRLLQPVLSLRLRKRAQAGDDWTPDRGAAQALLEDADRLAAEGRYGEATHLLLKRSVEQIAAARPHWLGPASTAREIAGLPALPERARRAFAAIAERVERSLFALRQLDLADWQAARAAYADFALADLERAPA
ncbi:MAG TPA: hypothetical protein VF418_15680 [Sphingomonadaceae bacterium]